ncbi:hypothetical protein BMS3Bbin11_00967 [bacterium BMS3Bbin11]|nr:hypothetical protein BMS3Bbin11_00967 [bacterium BMS3Bbin11]
MGDVLCFTGGSHAVALNRFRENYGWLPPVVNSSVISRINFTWIMATSQQVPDILIGHVRDHFQQLGIFTEEMFADKGTVFGLIGLVIAVNGLFHAF